MNIHTNLITSTTISRPTGALAEAVGAQELIGVGAVATGAVDGAALARTRMATWDPVMGKGRGSLFPGSRITPSRLQPALTGAAVVGAADGVAEEEDMAGALGGHLQPNRMRR